MSPERPRPAVILLVEDDALVQLELADWLADLGLAVLCADNADRARAHLEHRTDIQWLMTDIQMPGAMDGLGLAHHVAGGWPAIKIVVMSGMYGTPLSALPVGSLFFAKPVDRDKLKPVLSGSGAPKAPPVAHGPPPRFGCV